MKIIYPGRCRSAVIAGKAIGWRCSVLGCGMVGGGHWHALHIQVQAHDSLILAEANTFICLPLLFCSSLAVALFPLFFFFPFFLVSFSE